MKILTPLLAWQMRWENEEFIVGVFQDLETDENKRKLIDFIEEENVTIENQYSHEMRNYDLMKALNVISSNDADGKVNNDLIEKYVGHIKILWEDSILKSSSDNHGFSRITGGGIRLQILDIQLLSRGMNFLKC